MKQQVHTEEIGFPDKITLVGMPGSGKTTMGRDLARLLGYRFTDLDQEIEAQEKQSIAEIFAQKGEPYFRKLEAEVLKKELNGAGKKVIATGGGTPCYKDNALLLRQYSFVVWLGLPEEQLAERLMKQGLQYRPLLRNKNKEELTHYLIATLKQREPFYKTAHLHYLNVTAQATDLYLRIKTFIK